MRGIPFGSALLVMVALAGALRFYDLGLRPLQWDEGVNYYFLREVRTQGTPQYRPQQFHGPLFFLLLREAADLLAERESKSPLCQHAPLPADCYRDSESGMRLLPAVSGMLTLIAVVVALPLLGRSAAVYIMLLGALSPSLAFHSRYAIHEPLLLLFSALSGLMLLCFLHQRSILLLMGSAVCMGLCFAVKESALITAGALGAASLVHVCREQNFLKWRNALYVLIYAGVALAVSIVFLPPHSLVAGVSNWTGRALNDPTQQQPWWYFLSILARGDAAALLGIFAALACMISLRRVLFAGLDRTQTDCLRFFSAWGLAELTAYSLTPYKTPWLCINFVFPLTAAAALGLVSMRSRWARLVLVILPALSLMQTVGAVFLSDIDRPNAFMYAETDPAVRSLGEKVDALCSRKPDCIVLVELERYWPLPFYLQRNYTRIGYNQLRDASRALAAGDMVFIEPNAIASLPPGWQSAEYRISSKQKAVVLQK